MPSGLDKLAAPQLEERPEDCVLAGAPLRPGYLYASVAPGGGGGHRRRAEFLPAPTHQRGRRGRRVAPLPVGHGRASGGRGSARRLEGGAGGPPRAPRGAQRGGGGEQAAAEGGPGAPAPTVSRTLLIVCVCREPRGPSTAKVGQSARGPDRPEPELGLTETSDGERRRSAGSRPHIQKRRRHRFRSTSWVCKAESGRAWSGDPFALRVHFSRPVAAGSALDRELRLCHNQHLSSMRPNPAERPPPPPPLKLGLILRYPPTRRRVSMGGPEGPGEAARRSARPAARWSSGR